jgi:hypothetical protein
MSIKLFECSKCKKARVFNVDDLLEIKKCLHEAVQTKCIEVLRLDDFINKTNIENDLKNGLPYCHICNQYMKMKAE